MSAAKKKEWIEFAKNALKFSLLGLLFCAFFVAVWSGGPTPVPVSGVVTYHGKPLAKVRVVCLGSRGAAATGTTDENGRFGSLTTRVPGDGAFPGEYSVAILPLGAAPDATATASYEAPPPPPFPSRYLSAETSKLTITVSSAGENQFQLELKD